MTPHYADDTVTVHHGDCLDVLTGLPDDSVDAVVTDPPYGLANTTPEQVADTLVRWVNGDRDYIPDGRGFMGRSWDAFVPPVAVWDEALRVLKPGGHALVFAGSRTHDLMTLGLRLAGFDIRDSIAWLYGSGFPKSLDVSKAIDKMRDDRPDVLRVTTAIRDLRDAAGLSNRDLDDLFSFAGMAGHWTSTKSQPAVPTVEQWTKLRDVLSPPEWLEAEVWRLNGRKGTPGEAWESRPVTGLHVAGLATGTSGVGGAGEGKDRRDAPATPAAQQWQGWGTALKPAFEPIVVARKPLAGTVAGNVLAHGTGALNIDGCRVPSDGSHMVKGSVTKRTTVAGDEQTGAALGMYGAGASFTPTNHEGGRWPANVVLDGSQADALDEQSGNLTSGILAAHHTRNPKQSGILGAYGSAEGERGYGDAGGASRFFPTFRYEAKAPTHERPRVDGEAHSTVKPLDLIRWLVRLVCPPGGTVLDPFAGSGTTAEACIVEGFRCTTIEREAAYLPLIVARLSKPIQPDLFGAVAADAPEPTWPTPTSPALVRALDRHTERVQREQAETLAEALSLFDDEEPA